MLRLLRKVPAYQSRRYWRRMELVPFESEAGPHGEERTEVQGGPDRVDA